MTASEQEMVSAAKRRTLELEAFSSLVDALRAAGPLTHERRTLLQQTASSLRISTDRYKAEIRRALAKTRSRGVVASSRGGGSSNENVRDLPGEAIDETSWAIEGRRDTFLLPRKPGRSTLPVPYAAYTTRMTPAIVRLPRGNSQTVETQTLPLPTEAETTPTTLPLIKAPVSPLTVSSSGSLLTQNPVQSATAASPNAAAGNKSILVTSSSLQAQPSSVVPATQSTAYSKLTTTHSQVQAHQQSHATIQQPSRQIRVYPQTASGAQSQLAVVVTPKVTPSAAKVVGNVSSVSIRPGLPSTTGSISVPSSNSVSLNNPVRATAQVAANQSQHHQQHQLSHSVISQPQRLANTQSNISTLSSTASTTATPTFSSSINQRQQLQPQPTTTQSHAKHIVITSMGGNSPNAAHLGGSPPTHRVVSPGSANRQPLASGAHAGSSQMTVQAVHVRPNLGGAPVLTKVLHPNRSNVSNSTRTSEVRVLQRAAASRGGQVGSGVVTANLLGNACGSQTPPTTLTTGSTASVGVTAGTSTVTRVMSTVAAITNGGSRVTHVGSSGQTTAAVSSSSGPTIPTAPMSTAVMSIGSSGPNQSHPPLSRITKASSQWNYDDHSLMAKPPTYLTNQATITTPSAARLSQSIAAQELCSAATQQESSQQSQLIYHSSYNARSLQQNASFPHHQPVTRVQHYHQSAVTGHGANSQIQGGVTQTKTVQIVQMPTSGGSSVSQAACRIPKPVRMVSSTQSVLSNSTAAISSTAGGVANQAGTGTLGSAGLNQQPRPREVVISRSLVHNSASAGVVPSSQKNTGNSNVVVQSLPYQDYQGSIYKMVPEDVIMEEEVA